MLLERYREFLPITHRTPLLTLNEGNTPLIAAPRMAAALGVRELHLKFEGMNPTDKPIDAGESTLSTLAAALPRNEANALLRAGETVIRSVEKLARRSVANRQLLEHELTVIDQVMRIAHRGDRSTYAGTGTYSESPIAILDARA